MTKNRDNPIVSNALWDWLTKLGVNNTLVRQVTIILTVDEPAYMLIERYVPAAILEIPTEGLFDDLIVKELILETQDLHQKDQEND